MVAGASPAFGATYCAAPATGCGGGDYPTLAQALSQANGTPSSPDVVQLGAAVYIEGPQSYVDLTGTNPVTIQGSGELDSRIATLSGTNTLTMFNGNVDNVLVYQPPSGVSLSLTLGSLTDSRVLVGAGGRGVDAVSATIDDSAITPSGPSATGNLAVLADDATVTDTLISTTNGFDVADAPLTVRRAAVVTQGIALQSVYNGAEISDSVIVLNDPTAIGVQGICDVSIGTITVDARNLTVTGVAGGGTAFRSVGSQFCGGNVAVSSSLVEGVGSTATCVPGAQPGASASVTFAYSDADLSAGEVTGTCAAPADAGNNFLASPLLADSGPLTPIPRFDSPLVDTGDPADPAPGQPTDRRGLPRAVNGRRDVGAFEYGRRAPVLDAAAAPTTLAAGEAATFSATTSDPDQGDSVAVTWSFDDGAVASGDSVDHAFASAGTHVTTATATDSAGVTTVDQVEVTVTGGGDTSAPQTTITKAPKRKTTKRKATFAFTSSEPGATFECALDEKPASLCTSPFRKKVKAGGKRHRFSVVAIDAAGNRDPSPATYAWKVKRKR